MSVEIEIINSSKTARLPKTKVIAAVGRAVSSRKTSKGRIQIIYVTDKYIHELNNKYLKHNYPTDVISFEMGDGKEIDGEVYISIDTARRQANDYDVSLTNEVMRLAVHGTLHLLGFDDQDDASRNKMRLLEEKYINE
jgi:probable rRNA maturation factor